MIQQLNSKLLYAIISLLAIGLLMLLSATYHSNAGTALPSWYIIKQLMFIGLASIGVWIILWQSPILSKFNIQFIFKYTYHFYVLCLLLLILVLAIGHEANGSKRWLQIFSFTIQPSELAKLAVLLAVARTIAEQNIRSFGGIVKNILLIFPFLVLLFFQPDFGAIFIIGCIALAILLISGINWKLFTISVMMLVLIFVVLVLLNDNRLDRLIAFFLEGNSNQGLQALIGINRGGWFGVGLGAGIQKITKLPEIHTDMIFSLIAEELGIIVILIIIGIYAYIYIEGFMIAMYSIKIGKTFKSYTAFGITFWMSFQTFYNILMNVGWAPIKGFTLPLISYGGSSMLVTLIAFAILLRIDAENKNRDA